LAAVRLFSRLALLVLLALAAVAVYALVTPGNTLRRPHLTPPELGSVPCPAKIDGCRSVRGRAIHVERVDPDGDGDLHVVIVSRQSVTAPGVTVIKVPRRKRPDHIPSVGDSVAAAGPTERGAHGEDEIKAVAVRVLPR
jgi:hypothetical protein